MSEFVSYKKQDLNFAPDGFKENYERFTNEISKAILRKAQEIRLPVEGMPGVLVNSLADITATIMAKADCDMTDEFFMGAIEALCEALKVNGLSAFHQRKEELKGDKL